MNPIILIPARMASTRLPNKPLADIGGKPMIVRVAEQAKKADCGRVVVCTDSANVAVAVADAGFETVMTREDHQSGSDRIHEALLKVDPQQRHDVVVNVQGDLPTIDPQIIVHSLKPLADRLVDIATLGAVISLPNERTNENVVKIVGTEIAPGHLRALYFTRATAPWGEGDLIHHIGLYAYRREALERFVALGPSHLEKRERLEQLRALEAGMRIDAVIVKTVPLGVDTPHDLERARQMVASNGETA